MLPTGAISDGSQTIGVLLLEPSSVTRPSPPVLFAYSTIEISGIRADLSPMASRLARDGATVLVLQRHIVWETVDDTTSHYVGLLDCTATLLLSLRNLDLLHITYVGPRIQDGIGPLREPLAIRNLKLPKQGDLLVPLAEARTGSDTLAFTKPEIRQRTLETIERHWLVPVSAAAHESVR